MKKVLLALGVVAMFAFATSCSKEKDCTCTTSYSGTGSEYFTPTTADMHIEDGDCSDGNATVSTMGVTATTECKEK